MLVPGYERSELALELIKMELKRKALTREEAGSWKLSDVEG